MTVASKMVRMPAKKPVKKGTYSLRVAARFRALRDEREWLVGDVLARLNKVMPEELHIAASTLHGWDNGNRKIDPDYYPYIARVFGLSVLEFLPKS